MRRTFALVTGVLTCALLAACDGGDVSYRPPVAATFDRADCQAPDIERRLTALVDDGIDTGPPAQGVGYPPADFMPVSVVRCERGENSSGALTIDSVRLEGDIGAAWDAFREESERFPEGAMASCIRQTPSVAVWFVDDEERAVRPAWPSTGCGPKDGPIAALAKLREVDRQQHVTALRADDPGVCDTKFGSAFSTTTDADVRPDSEEERRARISDKSALAFPIDGIGRLQVCRYRETGGESTQESRSRLTVQQSGRRRARCRRSPGGLGVLTRRDPYRHDCAAAPGRFRRRSDRRRTRRMHAGDGVRLAAAGRGTGLGARSDRCGTQ
ncbi:hypothetical protein GS486_10140 [Rhodococcus hoagii]|nr:hypothetical protein [Prescottella equi]